MGCGQIGAFPGGCAVIFLLETVPSTGAPTLAVRSNPVASTDQVRFVISSAATAIQIYDPLERELPPAESYSVTDGTTRLQFHAGNRGLRARYSERFERQEARLQEICRQTLVEYRSIPTSQPLSRLGSWS